ncbi:MAG: nuclear transport factor 2 family protein [Planctomycetota bacterium]
MRRPPPLLLLVPCACTLLLGCAAPIRSAEVQTVLDSQAAAWNRGDLEAFVTTYWNDPRLSFCGKTGIVRGRDDLLATYQRGYPTAEARGTLAFELLEVRPLGSDAALVLGRYTLDRTTPAAGYFTLIVERKAHGLVITHDHTSGS